MEFVFKLGNKYAIAGGGRLDLLCEITACRLASRVDDVLIKLTSVAV
jgi:hypothetical protein